MILVPARGIRLLLALGLLVALGVPSWFALSARRTEFQRQEQAEDTVRFATAQRIAAGIDRSIHELRRATVLLASDRQVRALFTASSDVERQRGTERLVEAADTLGLASIQARDAIGRPFFDAIEGESAATSLAPHATAKEASIGLHVPVTDDDGTPLGQLVAFVPVDDVVDVAELGAGSVNTLDGRVLLDAEGIRQNIVLDVVSTEAPDRPPSEAGLSEAAAGGQDVAFALVPSAPLLITVTGRNPEPPTMPYLLWIDGALMALGLLGILGIAEAEKKRAGC